MMPIICKNSGCAYCSAGACTLSRAARAGTGGDRCAYFVAKE